MKNINLEIKELLDIKEVVDDVNELRKSNKSLYQFLRLDMLSCLLEMNWILV